MTPPPPGRAAPSAPRARVLSLPARFGLPLRLRLLLVFWVAAASAQGHSRSGPRISAVWKGRRRRAAGGARDRTLCGAGAECAAPGESACAQLCGSQAGPEGSVWVRVSVCECTYCHAGAGWSAAACELVAGARAQLSGAPSPTAALSPSRSARARGEAAGPCLAEALWLSATGSTIQDPSFAWPAFSPRSPPWKLRALLARGAQARLVKGARTHCRRRCARAAGTKTPPPAPAPAPARSAGQARGWVSCGDPGQGAVQGLGAPGRCLCNARTGRSPLAHTWQLSPEIGTSMGGGTVPIGWGEAIGTSKRRIWGGVCSQP